jgi:hypothetical protein
MASQCADYAWNATIEKDGPVRVSRSGADVRIDQNIHVFGRAGLRGDLAKVLSLSGKSFDVRASAAMDVNVGLNEQWCPIVKAVPVGRWVNSASVEVVGKNCVGIDLGALGHPEVCAGPVNLGLSDVLNNEFEKHRDEIQRVAQGILPCDAVRRPIGEQWHPFSIEVKRGGRSPLFLNIEPKSAGASGLIAEENAMKVIVQVDATTTLGTSGISSASESLPTLGNAAAKESSLDVDLQAVAPYEFLQGELGASLKGKKFKTEIASGTVQVEITDVDIYPSNGSLVVGLKVDAKTPGRWFNTVGWVYLSGKPTPGEDGKSVSVENLRFATVLDNEFWSVAGALFNNEILAALKAHSTFDLSSQIEDGTAQITTAIANAEVKGLKITAGPPSIRLTGVDVASDNLFIETRLDMRFDTQLTADLLR